MAREVRKPEKYVRVFNTGSMLIDGGLWIFWDREGPGHPATHVGAQLVESFDDEADETRWVEADLGEDETVTLTLTYGEGADQVKFDLHFKRLEDGVTIDCDPCADDPEANVMLMDFPAVVDL